MLIINLVSELHTGSDITWLLWVALGFFGLMVVIGWLTSRNKRSETENDPSQSIAHEQEDDHH